MATNVETQLQRIAAGDADVLELERLSDAARSLRQLASLIEWLREHGAQLVAADVRLDTRRADGRQMVALLAEVARWERAPERPRGRPGLLARDPSLAERIAALRERGLSLNQIADQLNEDRVPTPRGGAQWRASSVQSALGYRRPSPRPPGAPKPPRPQGPPGPEPPPSPKPRAARESPKPKPKRRRPPGP